jgi:hypothetical protein
LSNGKLALQTYLDYERNTYANITGT